MNYVKVLDVLEQHGYSKVPYDRNSWKKCKGFDISSPSYSLSNTIQIIGLVDDKRQYANNWKENSEKTICDNLQREASSWEQILHTSGEALEITKRAWYLITWEFTDSGPPCINKNTKNKTEQNHSFNDSIIRTIQQLQTTEKCKYLGVTSAPDGNQHHQFQVIPQNAKTCLIIISSSPLNHYQAFLYLISHLLPKLTYSLISAALDTKQYKQIKGSFHPFVVAAIWFNRTWLIALLYGTHQYGRLKMQSLAV